MKLPLPKLTYTLVVIVLASAVYFVVNSLYQQKVDKGLANTNNPTNINVSANNTFTGKYINKELGVEMVIPPGLILSELPIWQLVYDPSFPGNPEPDIALSIKFDPSSKEGIDTSKDTHFLISLYKRKIDSKTLLGNHTPFNDVPGKPLNIFGKGVLKIGKIDFQKYEFYSSTMNGVHIFDLAGNPDSDSTVYASIQMLGYPILAIDNNDSNLLLMKQMIQSLRFNK